MTKEEQARENRARMPIVTAVVDEYREVFGPGIRVTYAKENGIEIGTRMPGFERVVQPQSIQLTTPTKKITYAYALRRKKGW
jgi:putative component of toxin-antitoxin plasmid stabilization module